MNKTIISKYVDLLKYNYATIVDVMEYGGSPILMDLSIRIYDGLASTRLTVIGDKQINALSDDQKRELLLVQYGASQNDVESAVSINFVEYLTGIPVASFRGAYGMGLTPSIDMDHAIKNAIEEIKYNFKKPQ